MKFVMFLCDAYRIVNINNVNFTAYLYFYQKKKKYIALSFRSALEFLLRVIFLSVLIFWYFYDGFLYFYYVSRCTISWNLNRNAPYIHTFCQAGLIHGALSSVCSFFAQCLKSRLRGVFQRCAKYPQPIFPLKASYIFPRLRKYTDEFMQNFWWIEVAYVEVYVF